ncbi:MAG: hypothetical protein KUG70_06525 [Rhodobacteraceae bacterium]|nr:hypothetical protein [Paracoccaceae bacterium]
MIECRHTLKTNPLKIASTVSGGAPKKGRPTEILGSFNLIDHIDAAIRVLECKPAHLDREQWLRQEWSTQNQNATLDGENHFIRKIRGKRGLTGQDFKVLHGILGLYDVGLQECCVWLDIEQDTQKRRLRFSAAAFADVLGDALTNCSDPIKVFAQISSTDLYAEFDHAKLQQIAIVAGHEVTPGLRAEPIVKPRRMSPGEYYSLSVAPCVAGNVLIVHHREGQDYVQIANEAFGLTRDLLMNKDELFVSNIVQAPYDPGLRSVVFVNWPAKLDAASLNLSGAFDPSLGRLNMAFMRRLARAVLQTKNAPAEEKVHVRLVPFEVAAP